MIRPGFALLWFALLEELWTVIPKEALRKNDCHSRETVSTNGLPTQFGPM
jgi:hypothetical protein